MKLHRNLKKVIVLLLLSFILTSKTNTLTHILPDNSYTCTTLSNDYYYEIDEL